MYLPQTVNYDMMTYMKIKIHRINPNTKQEMGIVGGIDAVLSLFQDHKCFYCGTMFINEMNHPTAASRDHFLPKSKGHTFAGNVILACRTCNSHKRSNIPSANQIRQFVKLYNDAGLACCIEIIQDDEVSGRVQLSYATSQPFQKDEVQFVHD